MEREREREREKEKRERGWKRVKHEQVDSWLGVVSRSRYCLTEAEVFNLAVLRNTYVRSMYKRKGRR